MTTTNKQRSDKNNLPISSDDRSQKAIELLHSLCIRPNSTIKDYQMAYQNMNLGPAQEEEKRLYGVLLEWQLQDERHLLTAFASYQASYTDDGGKVFVWSRPEENILDALVEDVLDSGRDLLAGNMSPLDDDLLTAITEGQIRILLLSSHGIFAAEAPHQELSSAPMGAELVQTARQLSNWLVKA
jgi:hypothetical protein